MDWPGFATELLMRRSEEALVLLDNSGNIRSVNHALELMLGFRREEMEGKNWISLVAPLGGLPKGSRLLRQMQAGAFRRHRAKAHTKDGREITLSIEVSRLGQQPRFRFLLAVRVEERGIAPEELITGADFDYYIRASALEFGTLQKIVALGQPVTQMAREGRKCFQFFGRGKSPCPDCPALRSMHEPWPRIQVRKLNGSTEVITGQPVDGTTLQLSKRKIDDSVLRAIHEMRVGALADKARLSERERDVFKYLLMGRTQQDIAEILDLSRRTVKFHVNNVLDKVGAESRVDLFRVIGF